MWAEMKWDFKTISAKLFNVLIDMDNKTKNRLDFLLWIVSSVGRAVPC